MRLGLRARITALLLVLSIVPPGAIVWFTRARVLSLARAYDLRRIDDALAEFDAAIAREGDDVGAALTAAGRLLEDDPRYRPAGGASRPGGEAAVRPFPVPADAAPRLMDEAGLDCLSILDATGVVVSSGHSPARVGRIDRDRLVLPESDASFIEENIVPGIGRVLTLQSRRSVRLPGAPIHLIGGRFLDSVFLRRLSPAGTVRAVLLDRDGAILTASDPEEPLPVPPEWNSASRGGDLLARGVPHVFRTMRLRDRQGNEIGTLLAAVSQERLRKLSSTLTFVALGVMTAGVSGSLVLGLLMARGVTGPLRRLEQMTGRIAEDRYEPLAGPAPKGEIGALVVSFNRMAGRLAENRERLRQTERLAAAEEVARRVAHEIKNPLSPIALTLEGLVRTRRLRPQEFDAAFDDAVRTIQEEIQRMRGILEDFARFGRLPLPRPRPADLNELARSAARLHLENSAGVRIETALTPGLPEVLIDPDRISEVINNLLLNAAQALGQGGGTITIDTRALPDGAELCVRDTGPGIEEDVMRSLFEPYVSTRPGGSGLGLAIARRIVLDHGGLIEARNREEGGALIRIVLPWAPAAPGTPRENRPDEGTRGHEEEPWRPS